MQALQKEAYATSTISATNTALSAYAVFCQATGLYPHHSTGITDEELALFITFLARSLATSTILTYISLGVRKMHQDLGMPWKPLSERPQANATYKGLQRTKGPANAPKRKAPITVDILRKLEAQYNRATLAGTAHVACLLIMFFALLRKSNTTISRKMGKVRHVLRRRDVTVLPDGSIMLTVTSTKTIQFGQRKIEAILPIIANDPLCPTTALKTYLEATPGRPQDEPLFGYHQPDGKWKSLSYEDLLAALKSSLTRAGLDAHSYAAHSFRRGGATYAFFQGIPEHMIMLLGDWKSYVWRDYVEVQTELRRKAAQMLADGVNSSADPAGIAPPAKRQRPSATSA